jgi:hypothetical protein
MAGGAIHGAVKELLSRTNWHADEAALSSVEEHEVRQATLTGAPDARLARHLADGCVISRMRDYGSNWLR